MTVRRTKTSTPGSPSKTAVKTAKLVSTTPKTAAKEGKKLVDTSSTMAAAAAAKAEKKATAIVARPAKTSSPRSRTKTAARAVELAPIPPKAAVNAALDVTEKGVDAAAMGEVLRKEAPVAVPSLKALDSRSKSNTVAKVVELASIPPKAAANEAMKIADEASTVVEAASEAVKNESAYGVDIYKGSGTIMLDSTADIAKAVSEVATGVTELQPTIWSSMQRVVQAAVEVQAHFAACTSFGELVETQRGILRQGFSEWLNISQEILMANRRITDRAINALELH